LIRRRALISAADTGCIEASGASVEGSGGISRDAVADGDDGAACGVGGGGGARAVSGRDVLWVLGAAGGVREPFCVGGGAYLGVLAVKKDLIELCWPGLLVGRDILGGLQVSICCRVLKGVVGNARAKQISRDVS
jgi:hypothetical protein